VSASGSATAASGGWRSMASAGALIGIIGLTVVPLPAFALDLLLGMSLCLSVLIFLVALYVEKPLDFSAFPSVLLLTTLLRLGLNIASTRRILLHGNEGVEAAGGVIRAFGEFAVGGNFVVGAVVFLILVIINFIVITKGADRISEVAARFTLDSMPGKQMAIDADLGAGLINDKEARARRHDIEMEADFHGSMDGASKFVRGDAVAGLLIVGINVLGGMIVGVAQQGMSFADAAKNFTTLSIGDGLVSQLPALMISTGAALLTTRSSSGGTLGNSVAKQLFASPQAMGIAAAVLGTLGLVPGMPHLAFLGLGAGAGFAARKLGQQQRAAAHVDVAAGKPGLPAAARANDPVAQKNEIESMLPLELVSLEVGLDLLPLVDASRSGELLGRIASMRKQLALEIGLIVPPVHVRDDLRQRPGAYKLLVSGVKVAEGEVRSGRLLAIHPSGGATAMLQGESVREPTFGLPAKWIVPAERSKAEAAGCTVVDASAVIATHLTEMLRRHAHELLGRKEAQELMELAAKQNSKVVEELVPHLMPLGEVIKVLRLLLQESVSIRDIRTILEALADHAAKIKDPNELCELVRQRLGRQLCAQHVLPSGELRAMVLDPRAEELFRTGGRGSDPQALSRVTQAIETAARQASERDEPPVLVVAPDVRRHVAAVALRYAPGLSVLSYRELDPSLPFVARGVVGADASGKTVAKADDRLFQANG
jgi:flagellar biosynthesis protein FlhA